MRRLIVAVLALLVVAAAAAGVLYSRVDRPFQGYTGAEQFVEIPAGTGPTAIGRRLVDAGIVRDQLTWRIAVLSSGSARALKAGEYRFAGEISPRQVIARLVRGDVYLRPLTFPEGLTIVEMSRLYETREFGAAQDFLDAARNTSLIRDLDPAAPDLEGYLFPETYALPRGTPAARLIAMMVERFRASYTEELQARAREQQLTTRQVVTLASLIEKETAKGDERPLVAAVYRNRMRIGMGMQADPTIVYALQQAGRYDGNIRREDLAIDSPYNTYRHPGLPPGPIASPGKASLEAALSPADVGYLYFVSRNDGSHVFAETLAAHNRNVQEFQVEYFRRQRANAQ
jgi:UPF0755 protein